MAHMCFIIFSHDIIFGLPNRVLDSFNCCHHVVALPRNRVATSWTHCPLGLPWVPKPPLLSLASLGALLVVESRRPQGSQSSFRPPIVSCLCEIQCTYIHTHVVLLNMGILQHHSSYLHPILHVMTIAEPPIAAGHLCYATRLIAPFVRLIALPPHPFFDRLVVQSFAPIKCWVLLHAHTNPLMDLVKNYSACGAPLMLLFGMWLGWLWYQLMQPQLGGYEIPCEVPPGWSSAAVASSLRIPNTKIPWWIMYENDLVEMWTYAYTPPK